MRELKALGRYTRGSESLGHFFTMFRASVARHVVLSAVVGLLVGGISFHNELNAKQMTVLPQALGLDLMAWVAPDHIGEVELPSGRRIRVSVSEATVMFEKYLDGRPGGFIVRQWLLRSFCVFVLIALLLFVALLAYGAKAHAWGDIERSLSD